MWLMHYVKVYINKVYNNINTVVAKYSSSKNT